MPNSVSIESAIPPGYAILPAEEHHLAFLNGIEKAAARIFPPEVLPPPMRDDAVPLEILTEAMALGRLWTALGEDGVPVGYALLRLRDGCALLAQMDVHPAHARRGLGKALVATVVEAAGRMGLPALYLTTFEHIPWNAPFYVRLGFGKLRPGAEPPFVRAILREERKAGLSNRLAMARKIAGPAGQ